MRVGKWVVDAADDIVDAWDDIRRSIQRAADAQKQFDLAARQGAAGSAAIPESAAVPQSAAAIADAQQGEPGGGGWLQKLQESASSVLNADRLKAMGSFAWDQGLQQQALKDQFVARTRDEQTGGAMFEHFRAEALAAGQDAGAYLRNTLSFMSVARDADQLSRLNDLATRLQAFDSAGNGLEAAASALMKAMEGDLEALSSYGLSGTEQLAEAGDTEGFIRTLNRMMEEQGMGQQAFDSLMQSPAKQLESIQNQVTSAFANIGMAALQGLAPLINVIHEAFRSGQFQPFFDAISAGVQILAEAVSTAGAIIFNNMDLVRSILLAVGLVVAALAATWLVSWVAAAWPILAVIGVLAGLLYILNLLGVTTEQVVGFVTGVFYAMAAYIWNAIALVWNSFLAFAEFLANLFIDPVYAINKLFYDLFRNVIEFLGGIINGAIDGINWLIEKLNNIPGLGLDIPLIPKFESDWVEKLKPVSDKNVVDLSKYRMEPKDLGNAFSQGYAKGADLMNKATGSLNHWDWKNPLSNGLTDGPLAPGTAPVIDRVNEVGRIGETVDVSNEDLKMMRELAEMKNIQNFVTLTPTVSVQTGDIRQEADIDTIISRINRVLEDEIASSARGVFA